MRGEVRQPPRRIGRVVYLQSIAPSGKAIKVSVESRAEARGRTSIWVPVSQIHSDSEIYGIDEEGRRQLIGSSGKLIVSAWWCEQDDNATRISEHEVPMQDYAP